MTHSVASIKHVNQTLKKYGLHAKKHFGQNFIVDRNIINKIVKVANVDPTSHVLEIGPGIGSLTEALCEQAQSVISVEIDAHMIEILNDTFKDTENLTLVHQDFLEVDLSSICKTPMIVCANLPYYVTTPILFKLFESDCEFERIVVMVQKEVALRFKAKKDTKQYNALSIFAQTCFDVDLAFDVSKHVFIPKPDVDSSVLVFAKKDGIDAKALAPVFNFIRTCFVYRRKTLANNLKEIVEDASKIPAILSAVNLAPSVRAQNLDFNDFQRLYEVIYEN